MPLTLICNARLPSEKAHPWQVVQMWEAFNDVEPGSRLLYPFRFQRAAEHQGYGRKFWTFYGLDEVGPSSRLLNFDAVHVLDLFPSLVNVYSRVQQFSFAVTATLWFLPKWRQETRVWSREIMPLPFLRKLYPFLPLFYEMHRFPGSHINKQLEWLKACNGIICLTGLMKDKLVEKGFSQDQILVEPDAWSEKLYGDLPSKEEALKNLGLNNEKKKIVYTGHLYKWKGVDTLVKAMVQLPDTECHIVGGLSEDRAALIAANRDWPKNVVLHRHVPPKKIPEWLAIADLAVVPNSAESLMSREYTSPLKLFEILGAGVPLVASDLPSLREIVDENSASFVAADHPDDWARVLCECLNDPELSRQKVKEGKKIVAKHTWLKRAERISDFMKNA